MSFHSDDACSSFLDHEFGYVFHLHVSLPFSFIEYEFICKESLSRCFLSFSDVHQTIYLSLFILRVDRNVRDQAHQKLHDHDFSFGHTLQW